jgi:adenylate cyclase
LRAFDHNVLEDKRAPRRAFLPSTAAENGGYGGQSSSAWLTVMLCDIRGFTALSGRLNAQGLARFVNEYLTAMTDVVFAHGGT